MAYPDLRSWMNALEKHGELLRLNREVDWNLEAGAITRRSYETQGPAPLFENIKGYPGYRILGAPNGMGTKHTYGRLALSLSLPIDTPWKEIVAFYLERKKKRIPPRIVASGSCQENVTTGPDVDLYKLPAPYIHEGDGGRYLGTWGVVITRDIQGGWTNYGMYRLMIHDKNHVGINLGLLQHLSQQYKEFADQGRPMEFAAVIGAEPVTPLVGTASLDKGVNEADVIGAMRGEPLDLVRCKTVDLYVPATAEIVLEGTIDPKARQLEGPFGEYTGYCAGGKNPRPVLTVGAVTHRDNPIITMSSLGTPIDDVHIIDSVTLAAEALEELRDIKGFPVDAVYAVPETACHLWAISTDVPDVTYPRRLAMALWSIKSGRYADYVVLVNKDVDVTNLGQLTWAMVTRGHPVRDIWPVEHVYTSRLMPFYTPEKREIGDGAHILIDATWPPDWPKEWVPKVSSFATMWPKEIQQKVLRNWKTDGFEDG
ncbi:MAG: UbiD family decarboxylase [Desulfobacterales bacterium]|nr:UbiD family decarboxylase [Desulfobacterales bacterium]